MEVLTRRVLSPGPVITYLHHVRKDERGKKYHSRYGRSGLTGVSGQNDWFEFGGFNFGFSDSSGDMMQL
jgi:hypothetical protein